MNARNPKYNAVGTIDLEYEHPDFGWIPFTASPDDIEELGRTLYAQALAGDFGQPTAYTPPPAPVPASCSRRQGRLALLAAGYLENVESAINAITDPTAKRQAQIEYEADTWERSNPFLQSMWANLGGTAAELDGLFQLAVTL